MYYNDSFAEKSKQLSASEKERIRTALLHIHPDRFAVPELQKFVVEFYNSFHCPLCRENRPKESWLSMVYSQFQFAGLLWLPPIPTYQMSLLMVEEENEKKRKEGLLSRVNVFANDAMLSFLTDAIEDGISYIDAYRIPIEKLVEGMEEKFPELAMPKEEEEPSDVFVSPKESPVFISPKESPAFVSPKASPSPAFVSPKASPSPAFVSPKASPSPAFVSPKASPSPAFVSPKASPRPVDIPVQALLQPKPEVQIKQETFETGLPAPTVEATPALALNIAQKPEIISSAQIVLDEKAPGTIHAVAADANVPVPPQHVAYQTPIQAALFVGVQAEKSVLPSQDAVVTKKDIPSSTEVRHVAEDAAPQIFQSIKSLTPRQLQNAPAVFNLQPTQIKSDLVEQILLKVVQGTVNSVGGVKPYEPVSYWGRSAPRQASTTRSAKKKSSKKKPTKRRSSSKSPKKTTKGSKRRSPSKSPKKTTKGSKRRSPSRSPKKTTKGSKRRSSSKSSMKSTKGSKRRSSSKRR